MSSHLSIDFETPYGADFSVVDLGYWKYAYDPRCVPYLISVCDGTESWAGEPKDFNFESLRGRELVSHNSAFDEAIALGAQERGLFEVPGLSVEGMTHWFCTLNMASYLWNVRSLKDAAKHGLGIDISKDVRDRSKDKSVDDIKREGFWEDMLAYGRSDAQNCWQLWDRHSAKWPELERRLSRQTIDQGRYGVRIDVAALEQGIAHLQKVIFTATANLPWIVRGRKPASPIGIAEECRIVGIPAPPIKAHHPEAAQEWEDEFAPKFKFVLALKNIRKAKKTLATLETIKLRLRDDETVAFSLKYCGAATLRWSGDSGWNLQNMNKEPLFIDAEHSFIFDFKATRPLCEEFDKEHAGHRATGSLKNGTTFFDFRGLIVARPGMKLAPVDLAQIEPRVLNWLAGNHKLLKMVAEGLAIYEAHARDTMGWAGGELKTEAKATYQLAKIRVLALGYGSGWEKLITIAASPAFGCIDLTEGDEEFAKAASVDGIIYTRWPGVVVDKPWLYDHEAAFAHGVEEIEWPLQAPLPSGGQLCVFVKATRKKFGVPQPVLKCFPVRGMRARTTVDEFRRTNPLTMGLHQQLQEALEAAVGGDLVLEGPHGGVLTYRNVQQERRKKKDKETGEEYLKTVYTAQIGGFREILYGALLCENLVQWISRMVFAERQLELDDELRLAGPDNRVLFTVHDEAVAEISIELVSVEIKAGIETTMSQTPSWLPGCPLAAEGKIVDRYLK